jgi:hypothetical protein
VQKSPSLFLLFDYDYVLTKCNYTNIFKEIFNVKMSSGPLRCVYKGLFCNFLTMASRENLVP